MNFYLFLVYAFIESVLDKCLMSIKTVFTLIASILGHMLGLLHTKLNFAACGLGRLSHLIKILPLSRFICSRSG